MYIYIYIYMYVYIYIYMYIYIHTCIYIYTCMCIYIYMYLFNVVYISFPFRRFIAIRLVGLCFFGQQVHLWSFLEKGVPVCPRTCSIFYKIMQKTGCAVSILLTVWGYAGIIRHDLWNTKKSAKNISNFDVVDCNRPLRKNHLALFKLWEGCATIWHCSILDDCDYKIYQLQQQFPTNPNSLASKTSNAIRFFR